MTEISGKANDGVPAAGAVQKLVGDQSSAGAGTTGNGTTAAAPQSSELIRDTRPAYPVDIGISAAMPQQCSLKIEAAKAADPFFSGRKHFPELDGLRGLAISLVLISHFCAYVPVSSVVGADILGVTSFGGSGVDLFFVLSGFLITGILLDSKGQGRFFVNFYARRFLRIFPLYYGILAVTLIGLCLLSLHGGSFGKLPANLWALQPWLWTYTLNIGMIAGVKGSVFTHFWSLAVEEQFYLVWPLVVFFFSPRGLWRICLFGILGSFLLRLALTWLGVGIWSLYVLPITHLDPLLAGAGAALAMRHRDLLAQVRPVAAVAATLSLAVVLLLVAIIPVEHVYYDGSNYLKPLAHGGVVDFYGYAIGADISYFVLAVLFVFTLWCTVRPAGGTISALLGRGFRMPFLRWLGRYSYGIYALHLLVIYAVLAMAWHSGLRTAAATSLGIASLLLLAALATTLLLAFASYHLYEKHFLKLKKYFPERAAAAGPISNG